MIYKSIFISDVHLGTKHSRTNELINFLRVSECENLFIVGDLIDGWALKNKWYWDDNCNLLIQKILRKSRKGCNVIYLPGNHDEFLRDFDFQDISFGGIKIVPDYEYECVNGKRYLIIHGDKFDGMLNSISFISKFGSWMYAFILDINLHFNKLRRRFGFTYYSLSHKIKTNIKRALAYASKYENAIILEVTSRNMHGVICGHSHYPMIKRINDIDYINCGCFVEMTTLVVEHLDGRFELLDLDCFSYS
jgi:UDP-2,3-diacylglucosamine pyrophosphatase LpxH